MTFHCTLGAICDGCVTECVLPDVAVSADGTDFTGRVNNMTSSVTLYPNASSANCNISIVDDEEQEGDEVFDVVLAAVPCGGILGSTVKTTVTINDNEGIGLLEFLQLLT